MASFLSYCNNSRTLTLCTQLMCCCQALAVAVQYGREEAVLKLLQLGADKTVRTKTGKSPADLAEISKHRQVLHFTTKNFLCGLSKAAKSYSVHECSQISKILASSWNISKFQAFGSMEETLSKFFKTNSESLSPKER